MKLVVSVSLFLGLLGSSFGDTIGWTRTDVDGTDSNVIFGAATSGSLDSESENIFAFSTVHGTSGPATAVNLPSGEIPMSAGEYIEVSYSFDQAIQGGGGLFGFGWQTADYELELFGGATWDTSDVSAVYYSEDPTIGALVGTEGVHYDVLGGGTSSIVLDNIEQSSIFKGELKINGSWSGLKVRQVYNSDLSGDTVFNGRATLDVSPVPEPSSALLSLGGLAALLLRRRR